MEVNSMDFFVSKEKKIGQKGVSWVLIYRVLIIKSTKNVWVLIDDHLWVLI